MRGLGNEHLPPGPLPYCIPLHLSLIGGRHLLFSGTRSTINASTMGFIALFTPWHPLPRAVIVDTGDVRRIRIKKIKPSLRIVRHDHSIFRTRDSTESELYLHISRQRKFEQSYIHPPPSSRRANPPLADDGLTRAPHRTAVCTAPACRTCWETPSPRQSMIIKRR